MNKQSFKIFFILISIFTITSCQSDDDSVCVPDQTLNTTTSNIAEVNTNKHQVYTDIVVNVSVNELWEVLTNFTDMPNWSSSFQGLSGNISNGSEVTATYIFPNPSTGEPTESQFTRILSYTEGKQFGWSAESSIFPGIVDNHTFRVEAISECQSRFIQTDEFQGTNSNFTTEDLGNAALPSYNQFNLELKTEAEN